MKYQVRHNNVQINLNPGDYILTVSNMDGLVKGGYLEPVNDGIVACAAPDPIVIDNKMVSAEDISTKESKRGRKPKDV